MLKLALIENLRRLAAETLASRRARLAADAYVARIGREAAAQPLPPALDIASVVQLLHRLREYGLRLSLRSSTTPSCPITRTRRARTGRRCPDRDR